MTASMQPVPEPERLARVVLSHACEPGDPTNASLVRQLGAQGAVEAQRQPKRDSALHTRIAAVDPAREMERADALGIRFVVPGDPEWPERLSDLEAPRVQGLGGEPVGLWVRGPLTLDRLDESVAIVGSRSSTVYGTHATDGIARSVARAGFTVVSGGAIGIDAAAHAGALAAGGRTLAVLSCGLDRVYPLENAPLLWHLSREHALVSEQAPGSSPTRQRFLARNRVIAALTSGTVLVEAALRSGALNTANWADQMSREVMGVPGPVTSASSQGVHERIRTGGAVLVSSGEHVLEMLGASGEHLVEEPRGAERPRDSLTRGDARVLEAVPVSQPAPVTSIAHLVALHPRDTDNALHRLSKAGFVEYAECGWRLAGPG